MLVLRTAIRSRPRVNVISSPPRWYHPTPRRLYNPFVEPYTWRTRVCYRPDGTPRSKWKGLFYTAAACVVLYLGAGFTYLLEEAQILTFFVRVQYLDRKYSSYDFSKAEDVTSYTIELLKISDPRFEQDDLASSFRQGLLALMTPEFHKSLRNELETLHALLKQDPAPDPMAAGESVVQVTTDLFHHLIDRALTVQGLGIGHGREQGQGSNGADTYETVA